MTTRIDHDPNAPRAPFAPESPSFWRRFLSATIEYAKFSSGAILLVLFCMAAYALVHQSGAANTKLHAWLLPLSLVVNVFAMISVVLTGYLLKRIGRLERELTKRDSLNSWSSMLRH